MPMPDAKNPEMDSFGANFPGFWTRFSCQKCPSERLLDSVGDYVEKLNRTSFRAIANNFPKLVDNEKQG